MERSTVADDNGTVSDCGKASTIASGTSLGHLLLFSVPLTSQDMARVPERYPGVKVH